MNNPLIFTDPSGYMPDWVQDEYDHYYRNGGGGGGGFNYFAGYDPKTGKYDPYHRYRGFNNTFSDAGNVGRFSRNPGPTGVLFDEEDNKYYSYQDPVSGKANAYFTDDEGRRVGQDGNRYYVWESEPFYGDRWVTAKRDGHTIFVRDFGVSAYKKYLFGFAVENWWNTHWTSKIIPDGFYISWGASKRLLDNGFGRSDGLFLPIRGKQAFKLHYFTTYHKVKGSRINIGLNIGYSVYEGDTRNFNLHSSLAGKSFGLEADIPLPFSAGLGSSISSDNNAYLYSHDFGVGIGGGFGFNDPSETYVYHWKDFFRW
jgi:hypothetical protein